MGLAINPKQPPAGVQGPPPKTKTVADGVPGVKTNVKTPPKTGDGSTAQPVQIHLDWSKSSYCTSAYRPVSSDLHSPA